MMNFLDKKVEDFLNKELLKKLDVSDYLRKKLVVEEEKKCNPLIIVLAVIGAVAAVAAIAYAVYYFFFPVYDEYEDEYEDEDADYPEQDEKPSEE